MGDGGDGCDEDGGNDTDARVFSKAILQLALLYEIKSRVVTGSMLKVLE